MAAPKRGPVLTFFWKLHKFVWRVSGGRIGARVVGLPVLELVTVGRKSGRERSVLLSYLDHDAGYAVIASNAGDDRQPGWWHNLQAHPRATVTVGGAHVEVTAREATGDERAGLWSRAVTANPGYADYAARTERPIPIVVLEPHRP